MDKRVSEHLKKGGKMMDKSKLDTLCWVTSLALMVLVAVVMTIAELVANALGVLLPNALVIVCGLVGASAMFGFGYSMVQKVKEGTEERYQY